MLRIGLTGGIGSGKSTVADLLARKGAALVDADEIAREVVTPGGGAYDGVVTRFGPGILGPDGTIDRAALAGVVFGDANALADLDALTHPVIGALMLERLDSLDAAGSVARIAGEFPGTRSDPGLPPGPPPSVAVAVIPLLRPAHVDALRLRAVVVVDCPIEVALRRLVEGRGMDEADARARVAAQPSREARLALADYVVDNGSTPAHLVTEVEALGEWLAALTPGPLTPGP